MVHMKQKCYNYDIILQLLKQPNYIRGLAKELNTNPMMVSRTLRQLTSENVVDASKQGKNKLYRIKRSIESLQMIMMAERYKLIQILQKYLRLRRVIQAVQEEDVVLAVLFGSYAKGTATKESDIDLFIEAKNKNIKAKLELVDSKISVKVGKYDPSASLAKEIWKHHTIIKGVEKFYEYYPVPE